jgi:hypothetical protein
VAGTSSEWQSDFSATPAFAHLRPWLSQLDLKDWPDLCSLNDFARAQNLHTASGLPLRFVTQSSHCGQLEYEHSIYVSGSVPSRERNWHDLFNALTWLAFPAAKAALNALHQDTLRAGDNRLPASDAATLFDESGLVLVGQASELAACLKRRDWHAALVERRETWADIGVHVIGHAVLEKLIQPWPGITAKCLCIELPPDTSPAQIDVAIARRWQENPPTPAQLFPLPVLGIPGWWPANEDPVFYADTRYFRAPR